MTEITQICKNQGISSVKSTLGTERDLETLEILFKVISLLEKAGGKRGQITKLYGKLKESSKNLCRIKLHQADKKETRIIEQNIEMFALTLMDLSPNDEDFQTVQDLLNIYKDLQKNIRSLPQDIQIIFNKKASLSPIKSNIEKIVDSLKETKIILADRIPIKYKNIIREKNQENITTQNIKELLLHICRSIRVKSIQKHLPSAPISLSPSAPSSTERFKNWLAEYGNYGFTLLSSYGNTISGENNSGLVQARGGSLSLGANLDFKLPKNLRLRLDYNGSSFHDFGKDGFVLNDDLAKLSITGNPNKKVSYYAQAGFRHYRNDFPTLFNPNQNSLVQSGEISYRIKPWATLDFNETTYNLRFLASAGTTLHRGRLVVSPALIGGINPKDDSTHSIIGGKLDIGINLGNFGLTLNSYGINYDKRITSIGWQVIGSRAVQGKIKLIAFLGPGEITFSGGENAANLQGGIGFSWGWPDHPIPTKKPLIFEPLPYLMGGDQ